jgi:hypothetical protein
MQVEYSTLGADAMIARPRLVHFPWLSKIDHQTYVSPPQERNAAVAEQGNLTLINSGIDHVAVQAGHVHLVITEWKFQVTIYTCVRAFRERVTMRMCSVK